MKNIAGNIPCENEETVRNSFFNDHVAAARHHISGLDYAIDVLGRIMADIRGNVPTKVDSGKIDQPVESLIGTMRHCDGRIDDLLRELNEMIEELRELV